MSIHLKCCTENDTFQYLIHKYKIRPVTIDPIRTLYREEV